MSIGATTLHLIVDWRRRGAITILSTSLARHWHQLRRTEAGVHTLRRPTTIECVDGGGGSGEPTEEIAGTCAVDVGSALHGLEGESGDEGCGGGGTQG